MMKSNHAVRGRVGHHVVVLLPPRVNTAAAPSSMGRQTSLLSFTKVATVHPGQQPLDSGNASGRLKENEAPQQTTRRTSEVNQDQLDQLVTMGFAQADCVAALEQTSHDLSAAVNKLLRGFTVGAMKPEEPPPARTHPQTAAVRPTKRKSPLRRARPVDEPLDQRLARRRVQTALSRAADEDAPPSAARWPLRAPVRQAHAAAPTVPKPFDASSSGSASAAAPSHALGTAGGAAAQRQVPPEWTPLDASMLQKAPNALVRKASPAVGILAPTACAHQHPMDEGAAPDMVDCPLCGARVLRENLARHMASESIDDPLDEDEEDEEENNTNGALVGAGGGPGFGSAAPQPQQADPRAGRENEVLVLDSSDDDEGITNDTEATVDLQMGSDRPDGTGTALDDALGGGSGSARDSEGDAYSFWQPMTKKPVPQFSAKGADQQQTSIINYSAMMQPASTDAAAAAAADLIAAPGNGSAGRLHPDMLSNPTAAAAGFRTKPRARGRGSATGGSTASSGRSGRGRGARGGAKQKKKWVPRGGWAKAMAAKRNR